ncbi:MAG: VOC family protein [Promethearchaeota archaeon]|jgi:catechol 2,3-dioxygenase-like lactoylglutathione lyase family enzyme
MKIDHVAVGSNSEQDADKFFIELLGLQKTRSFSISADLNEKFFGLKNDQQIIRYGNSSLNIEVFLTGNNEKAKDTFTHPCLAIDNRDEFLNKALTLGFPIIKVPRKNSDEYYLFIKDLFDNLYEIK